jgi:hypothetical protein
VGFTGVFEYLQLQLKPDVDGALQILSDNIQTITVIQFATEYSS